MNQRGFATIFGLCLILVFALVASGIHAAQSNYYYEKSDFGAELELQNAADNALIEAADMVLTAKENGEELLPVNDNPSYAGNTRDKFQVKLVTKPFGDITAEAWGEIINVNHYKVSYKGEDDSDRSSGNVANPRGTNANAYVFFSVAHTTNPHTGATIYRRAFAYVVQGDATIHFMTVPTSS